MSVRRGFLAALALAMLSACASSPPFELKRDGIPFETLPSQRLKAGECAMFLWTNDRESAEPRRIMMVAGDPLVARVKIAKRFFTFDVRDQSGETKGGLYSQLSFSGYGAKFRLDLKFAERDRLEQGFLVESGTLDYESANGWTAVMPVAGIVACEPAR